MKSILLFLCLSFSTLGAEFKHFFPHLMKSEGLFFVIVQYDRGGATKFGVTLSTYQMWCNQTVIVYVSCDKDNNGILNANDLRLTTLKDVFPIYQIRYWDNWNLNKINNQAIAELICDMLVNQGPGRNFAHTKAIQKMLGMKKQDGVIGSRTIRLINKCNPSIFYNQLFLYRYRYYYAIGQGRQRKFLRGWLNRIYTLKKLHSIK